MAEASSTEDVITLRIRFKSETLEKFAERYAADLTPNEIFIRTREPLPGRDDARAGVHAQRWQLVDLRARLGVVDPRPGGGARRTAGMGIRFETLNGGSRQMLGRILEAKARLSESRLSVLSDAGPKRCRRRGRRAQRRCRCSPRNRRARPAHGRCSRRRPVRRPRRRARTAAPRRRRRRVPTTTPTRPEACLPTRTPSRPSWRACRRPSSTRPARTRSGRGSRIRGTAPPC